MVESSVLVHKDSNGTKTHSCFHSDGEYVDQDMCEHISRVGCRSGRCVTCLSPWKKKDVKYADENAGLPSVAAELGKLNLPPSRSNS